jgi:uncharacterized membrane protein
MWMNLAALTAQVQRYLPDVHVARSSGVLVLVLVLFFIEHFVGLGRLHWLLPFTSFGAAFILWKQQGQLKERGFWRAEIVFTLAFLYAFGWRFLLPNIDATSERITDLYFISNYLPGTTLPPLDNWYPPHKFNFYYAFQHYAAALLGRFFGHDVGTAYNLAFALLMTLPITLVWSIGCQFIAHRWARLLLVAALVFGGTGFSPLLHLVFRGPEAPAEASESALQMYRHAQSIDAFRHIIMTARFIGDSDEKAHQDNSNKAMAAVIFPLRKPSADFQLRVLPLENFGYQFFLGDYHPPLGSFFLLLLTLALITCIELGHASLLSEALLGLTAPVMLITNTWLFPLQCFLLCGWIVYRCWTKQAPNLLWLIGGGVIGGLLIYPFLTDFSSNALSTPIKLVTADDHTPIARFIALQWPILLLMGLSALENKRRKLSVALIFTFGIMLLLSECIYIDDPTGGKYIRTNTVMKWWGWIYVGSLASMGAICLGSSCPWIRWPAVLVMLLINVTAYDVGRYLIYTGKQDAGRIQGHYWATKNPVNRDMYNFLQQRPRGIVLENVPKDAYMESSTYAVFNNKPVLLGWPSHIKVWHGDFAQVWSTVQDIRAFYDGKLTNEVQWLLAKEVRYIVLSPKDDASHFDMINSRIRSHYSWFGFNRDGERPVGIWARRNK